MEKETFLSVLEDDREKIGGYLSARIAAENSEQALIAEAMRYSVLGGKRLRGILVLEFCRLFGGSAEDALPFAAAIECVQAYSLVHDDLPCMDNDDLRRGKPSCHIRFGEANALLAGDALLTEAFAILAECELAKEDPERALKAASLLSRAAGYRGMVCGQVLDLAGAGKELSENELYTLDELKTAALIRCAAGMGCAAAGADAEKTYFSVSYANEFGLAFQIADDIRDFMEKPESAEPSSYVTVHGITAARTDAKKHMAFALGYLDPLDKSGIDTRFFRLFAEELIEF